MYGSRVIALFNWLTQVGFETEGLILVASPPTEFDRYFREEEDRWRKVIQDANIKAD